MPARATGAWFTTAGGRRGVQTQLRQLALRATVEEHALISRRSYQRLRGSASGVTVGGDAIYVGYFYTPEMVAYARVLAYYLLDIRRDWEEKFGDHRVKDLIPYEAIIENMVFE